MNINWERRKDVIFMNNMNNIEDDKIDVILVSHTLHHIPNDEIKIIIQNFYRILSENGILILKEHDSPDEEFNKKLDLQHMLYDTVLSQQLTYDNFNKKFYSNYKNSDEWDKFFSNFDILDKINLKKYDNSYICIYKKSTK